MTIYNKKNKKGFTLTELIVVIVIIGILAAVLIPTLTGYIKKANESADTQKVRNLNSLLYDVKISEDIEVNDVLELKQYLKEVMEYDGDFKLKTEGSYLWYNTEKVEFVVVKEKEVAGLKAAESNYKLVATLTSPEGLLEDAEGNELWLIGGNGALVDVVAEIRNVGNTGTSLTKYSKVSETLKPKFEAFFNDYAFTGSKGKYVIEADGTVLPFDSSNLDHADKNILLSDKSSEMIELFHKQVILSNLLSINEELNGTGVSLNIDNANQYKVVVSIQEDASILNAANGVFKVIDILRQEGCDTGYIIPNWVNTQQEMSNIVATIVEAYNSNNSEVLDTTAINFIETVVVGSGIENNEDLYTVDLTVFENIEDGTVSSDALDSLLNMIPCLKVALCLYQEDGVYKSKDNYGTNQELFRDKNIISLIGNIDSNVYGIIDVKYDFEFKFVA